MAVQIILERDPFAAHLFSELLFYGNLLCFCLHTLSAALPSRLASVLIHIFSANHACLQGNEQQP
jgi:hypothetical protein